MGLKRHRREGEGRGGSARRGAARAAPPRESSIASEQRGVISGCVAITDPGELVYPTLQRSFLLAVLLLALVPDGRLRRLGARPRRPRSVLNPSLMLC